MSSVFHIVPAGARPFWLLLPIFALMLVVLAVLAAEGWASQRAWFELSPAGLRLHGGLYGRMIPAAQLRGGAAELVDLDVRDSLMPVSRRFGTGLPGYGAGWFRLANGEKALVYLTDRRRVVYIPTTKDYAVLLSVADAEVLLARLQTLGTGTAARPDSTGHPRGHRAP